MYFYKFHIGDYKRATDHLTNEEDISYRRLLDMYYENEKPIPLDTQWVSRRLRVDRHSLEIVLKEFFVETQNGWTHTYCDKSIEQYHAQAERNRINGKGGGRPKKPRKNPVGSDSKPSSNPVETLTTNHKPLTTNQEKRKDIAPPDGVLPSVWDDFVKQRKAKKAAITATAIKGIEREAAKANISLNDALQEICARGWTGFKADWYTQGNAGKGRSVKYAEPWHQPGYYGTGNTVEDL